MNQELLECTIKNRRIELTDQEKKEYYPKGLLFRLLVAPVVVPLISVVAYFKGEIVSTEYIWFSVLLPIVTVAVLCLAYRNKKNTLKLHYIPTALTPNEQQEVFVQLAKENHWEIVECDECQCIADDHCFRLRIRVRVVAIFGNRYMAYNSRCYPNYHRYHASGGRNGKNRQLIRQAILNVK